MREPKLPLLVKARVIRAIKVDLLELLPPETAIQEPQVIVHAGPHRFTHTWAWFICQKLRGPNGFYYVQDGEAEPCLRPSDYIEGLYALVREDVGAETLDYSNPKALIWKAERNLLYDEEADKAGDSKQG